MKQTITVKVRDAKTGAVRPPRDIEARIYGLLAVHPDITDPDTHAITHIPTGLHVARDLYWRDARKVAKKVQHLDWAFKSRDDVARSSMDRLREAVAKAISDVREAKWRALNRSS